MGYYTEFTGSFTVVPSLSPEHFAYLKQFAVVRHMKRDVTKLGPDPLREAVGLPLGEDGEFWVGTSRWMDWDDPSIMEQNTTPGDVPGLNLDWEVLDAGGVSEIAWTGGEKFYNYVEWMEYLVRKFLTPWGYSLIGEIEWQGEDPHDRGRMVVDRPTNEIRVQYGRWTWS